jgi:hypothetical protein
MRLSGEKGLPKQTVDRLGRVEHRPFHATYTFLDGGFLWGCISDNSADKRSMKILPYPETRQVYNFDCGANALVSVLVYAGVREREDRVAVLASTTRDGTNTTDVLRVLRYYGIPHKDRHNMRPDDLRKAIDEGYPTIITLQAYRSSNHPYRKLWKDGHWVVAIGYDENRIIFEDPASFSRTWLGDEELRERWHDVDVGSRRVVGWGATVLVKDVYRDDALEHMD